jgi:hypothetical protein
MLLPALVAFLTSDVTHAATRLEGVVRDQAAPIEGARVELAGTRYSTVTGRDGRFSLGVVAAGEYTIRVMRIGYRPLIVPRVRVGDQGDTPPLVLVIERAPVPLAAVVVTPGYFGIMQPSIATPHTLTRQDIETVPQIGEDIYRAITRLPGVTADDYSARFSVRGATADAVRVTLDGLALTEPFHLRDIGGSLSIIDIQALGGAELTTGGPGVEYGEQLAGVFAMHSLEPRTDRTRTSLGLSIMNARAMSEGGFDDGRGGWLVSARRGYIDIALKLVSPGDSILPRYYDVFGKVQYDLGRAGKVSLHGLLAGDKLKYQDRPNDHIESKYTSAYAWLTWRGDVGARLGQQTVASVGRLDWRRRGGSFTDTDAPISAVDDDRRMRTLGLRQDWTYEMTPRAMLKAGFDGGLESADYDFTSWNRHSSVDANHQIQRRFDTLTVALTPDGSRFGAYVAQRVRLSDAITVEGGLRYDAGPQRDVSRISPRVNAAWEPRGGSAVRGSWGVHTQAHPLFAVQVEDGERAFHRAERAEQRVIGLEQALPKRLSARVEAYERLVSNPRPRYVNISGSIDMIPELAWDRVRVAPTASRARGVELFVGHESAAHVDWSANYVLSSTRIEIDGRMVPQQMDQRHAVRMDWAWHPTSNKWRLALAGQWHSGWPLTPPVLEVDTVDNFPRASTLFTALTPGAFNSERLPGYQRVDARWTRFFETKRGRVSLFLEVFNLFNAANTRGVFDFARVNSSGAVTVSRGTEEMLPRLPSVGIAWQF